MQYVDTPKRTTTQRYEAPVGVAVRGWALGLATVFSLVFAAMVLSQPNLAAGSLFWLIWAFATLVAVLVYGIGTMAFRKDPYRQSRRIRRWLKAGMA